MIYFMYKQIQITNIGGISIPTIEGINGGQGSYKSWLLGMAENQDLLDDIEEFSPRLISYEVFKGLSLINMTEIYDITTDQTRPLNEDEITWKSAAQNWIYKEDARNSIAESVGDDKDLIADLGKQVNILTGMLVRMYRLITAEVAIPADIKTSYDTFTTNYADGVDSGYKDRSDVEPDPALMIERLLTREATKASIVKTKYLDKKV